MTAACYGPAAWEDPAPRRYGPVDRVAVVSDELRARYDIEQLTPMILDRRR